MPKTYSDKEKEYLKKQLKKAAVECMTLYGVKKTTVDELVKKVNIPKGTFYLFYDSKELLLFDAINELHNELEKQFLQNLNLLSDQMDVDKLTDLLCDMIRQVDNTFLLKILTSGDMELIMRKLPDEVVEKHLTQDDFNTEKLFSFIPKAKDKNVEAFSGALRGAFLTLLYKREIGEEIFEKSLKLMIRGIILQLME